ncbi:hypothetical protein D3C77_190500 [compost metagenome]
MRVLAVILTLPVLTLAWAQGGAPTAPAAVQLQLQQKPATELLIKSPTGQLIKAPANINIKLHTQVLKEPASVSDVLRYNGLSDDPTTLDMLKRMNPDKDFSSGQIPAGTKIDLYTPTIKDPANKTDIKGLGMTFDSPVVGKWAVREQVAEVASTRKAAYELSPNVYENGADWDVHKKVVSDIDEAAQVLQAKADTMSSADLAVAQYQIEYASRRAAQLNEKAAEVGTISAWDITSAQEAAAPTQTMTARMLSGQTPMPLRRVKVSVVQQGTTQDVKGLQVYVLPAGIVDDPQLFSDADILTYLNRFSFIDETSPSVQNVAIFDARVWVGEKFQHAQMAELIKHKQLKKYRTIHDPNMLQPTLDLVFNMPDDLVKP